MSTNIVIRNLELNQSNQERHGSIRRDLEPGEKSNRSTLIKTEFDQLI